MKTKRWLLFLPLILFTGVFCNVSVTTTPTPLPPDVSQLVQETMAALTDQAPVDTPIPPPPTDTPVPPPAATGSISGFLSYPSEFIPPLRVTAFNIGTGEIFYIDTPINQGDYQIENLPPGAYHVVSYTMQDPYLAGGYSQMVPCGLAYDCEDHTLIDVVVVAGQDTPNINPGDWYAPEGSFPPKP